MKNTHIIVHCSWTIFNSNLPEMELKIFILNLWEIRVQRQRMWKENLQVFKNLYVLYTSHEKTLTANYIWFNFILGWCWHVMLRGRSCSAKEYRNIVLLTKFLGEMKVIFLVCNFPSLLLWHLWHYNTTTNCGFTFPWFWRNCEELAYQPGFWSCLVVLWQSIPCKHGIFNPHCPTRLSSASEFNSTTVISSSWM